MTYPARDDWEDEIDKTFNVVEDVRVEVNRALEKFPSFNSAHEGYAVILEELDELWEEIKAKKPSDEQMRSEAIQVAAMAIRFVMDLLEDQP